MESHRQEGANAFPSKVGAMTHVFRIFLAVTACAMMGTLLGAAFGAAAGWLAPSFWANLLLTAPVEEPIGFATLVGAFGGTICGGALGAFAVTVQAGRHIAGTWANRSHPPA